MKTETKLCLSALGTREKAGWDWRCRLVMKSEISCSTWLPVSRLGRKYTEILRVTETSYLTVWMLASLLRAGRVPVLVVVTSLSQGGNRWRWLSMKEAKVSP